MMQQIDGENYYAESFANRYATAKAVYIETLGGMSVLTAESVPIAEDTLGFIYQGKQGAPFHVIDAQLSMYTVFSNNCLTNWKERYQTSGGIMPYSDFDEQLSFTAFLEFFAREHNEHLRNGVAFGLIAKLQQLNDLTEPFFSKFATNKAMVSIQLEQVSWILTNLSTKNNGLREYEVIMQALEIARNQPDKPILFLQSHGDSWPDCANSESKERIKSDWLLIESDENDKTVFGLEHGRRYEKNQKRVSYYSEARINDFLEVIDQKYGSGFFSLIILNSCNPGRIELPSQSNTPILYAKGNTGYQGGLDTESCLYLPQGK